MSAKKPSVLSPDYKRRLSNPAPFIYSGPPPPRPLFGEARDARDCLTSPSKSVSCRFVPQRDTKIDISTSYAMSKPHNPTTERTPKKRQQSEAARTEEASKLRQQVMLHQICPQTPSKVIGIGGTPVSKKPRVIFPQSTILNEVYNSSPFDRQATYMITRPQHPTRFIPKGPFKVLDAPDLQDDFYLNLVDWSSSNLLGVGLGNCVYLWNANTCNVTKLCEVGPYDSITSVNWNQRGNLLSVGTNKGAVLLWDAQRQTCLREYQNHTSRVGALAWNNNLFSSGSRDRHIIHHDVRTPNQYTKKLSAHKQEVCGLRWNEATDTLASGGNDNKLFVWEKVNEQPLRKFDKHQAAVKALAWSPRNPSILASGGGTADRTIRFWDVQQGTCIKSVETNSQVCNLAFSKNSEELVSTHGYSQNQIVVWSEPEMEQLAVLTGHTYRVLYLAMSPDGESIVTGAGDETLRFWRVFEKGRPIVQPTHGQWSHIR